MTMLRTIRRQPIDRPAGKIAGIVYIVIGVIALSMAAFVLYYQGTLVGPITNLRTGVGIVIILYALFRIYTGISTLRRAGKVKDSVMLNGEGSNSKPPLP